MIKLRSNIAYLKGAILNSYSQVFFSSNTFLASILLLVSFFDVTAGICGLLSVIIGLVLAHLLDMDKASIGIGLFSFNNLLVGLGIGLHFQLSLILLIIVVFASILTSFITIALQGILGKYKLPFLSIPFLFAIWISLMATSHFSALGLSIRGVYTQNEIYAVGGLQLLDFFRNFDSKLPLVVLTYFKSLGAIFFQYNVLAGILISLGLLVYSRIIFSLSVFGFVTALAVYQMFGIDINQLSYSYIGFNYILTSIAIGGFFLLPNTYSYLVSLLLLPMVILMSFGIGRVFEIFQLSIYSLPFNILVIMFLYALRFRTHRATRLLEILVQQKTPEKNVYLQSNAVNRMRSSGILSISLPFMGKWTVNQGYDGEITHKDDWRHALDFVLTDATGREYRGDGLIADDYYCFGKNIIAPADGYVVDVIDGIADNLVGDMDLVHNWGNTIVIQHVFGLCTQMSHIRMGTIEVNKGDFVQKGQVIGKVGNSGRSPYPHLHFQIQNAPLVGSATMDYPLCNYIVNEKNESHYQAHGIPAKGQIVDNVVSTPIIANAFNFIPGQELTFKISYPFGRDKVFKHFDEEYTLVVNADIYKNLYLECKNTGAKAWFSTDGQLFSFSNYAGDRNSFLFYFMLSVFKVELAYSKDIIVRDEIPTHFTFSGVRLFFQDFIAPFKRYLKSYFHLEYEHVDDEMSPEKVLFNSEITSAQGNKTLNNYRFDISINNSGIHQIDVNMMSHYFQAVCIKQER